jgi:hypothetical protein
MPRYLHRKDPSPCPPENPHHPPGCGCAQHNWGVGYHVSHDDGCPRRYPRVHPTQVMIQWGEHSSAATALLASVATTGSNGVRLPPAAASFYESYQPDQPVLTVVSDHPGSDAWDPASGVEVDAHIDSIAEQVRNTTPSGVAGEAIETAIAATLERVERVVQDLERRVHTLAQHNEVDEIKQLNAKIVRLVDDVPAVAAAAVNDVPSDLRIAGAGTGAITGDMTAEIGEKVLAQIPEVVDTYLRHRNT